MIVCQHISNWFSTISGTPFWKTVDWARGTSPMAATIARFIEHRLLLMRASENHYSSLNLVTCCSTIYCECLPSLTKGRYQVCINWWSQFWAIIIVNIALRSCFCKYAICFFSLLIICVGPLVTIHYSTKNIWFVIGTAETQCIYIFFTSVTKEWIIYINILNPSVSIVLLFSGRERSIIF